MDALDLLRDDHDKVRSLFDDFRSAHDARDVATMQEIATEVFHELEVHTAIEEEIFYPAVREAGGETLGELVDESNEEHHVVDVLMAEIRELDAGDDAFAAKMTVLIENVEHHAGEEEDEMFPKVRELMNVERRGSLGVQLEKAKDRHRLAGMSHEELYDKAAKLDVAGRSSMTKDELAGAVGQLLDDSGGESGA